MDQCSDLWDSKRTCLENGRNLLEKTLMLAFVLHEYTYINTKDHCWVINSVNHPPRVSGRLVSKQVVFYEWLELTNLNFLRLSVTVSCWLLWNSETHTDSPASASWELWCQVCAIIPGSESINILNYVNFKIFKNSFTKRCLQDQVQWLHTQLWAAIVTLGIERALLCKSKKCPYWLSHFPSPFYARVCMCMCSDHVYVYMSPYLWSHGCGYIFMSPHFLYVSMYACTCLHGCGWMFMSLYYIHECDLYTCLHAYGHTNVGACSCLHSLYPNL